MPEYDPTTWVDEVPAETPIRYKLRDANGDILHEGVTIELETEVTPGTPLNAARLNKIEQMLEILGGFFGHRKGRSPTSFGYPGDDDYEVSRILIQFGATQIEIPANEIGDIKSGIYFPKPFAGGSPFILLSPSSLNNSYTNPAGAYVIGISPEQFAISAFLATPGPSPTVVTITWIAIGLRPEEE